MFLVKLVQPTVIGSIIKIYLSNLKNQASQTMTSQH